MRAPLISALSLSLTREPLKLWLQHSRIARDDAVAADAVDGREREVEGPVEREEARGRRELVRGVAELLAVLFQVVVPGLCVGGFE